MPTTIPPIPNPSNVSIPNTSNLGTVPAQYNSITGQASNIQNQATNIQNQAANIQNQAANIRNQASGSLNKLKSSIDKIKGKQDNNNIFKQIPQPSDFLKSQKDFLNPLKTSFSKDQITNILLPVISKFAKVEYIANLLIKKLEKQTREQVKNKGKLTVINGLFTFTPADSANYSVFKNNFDRKVSNIKKSLNDIKRIITLLNNVIKILNIALSVIQIYNKIKLAVLLAKSTSVTVDLSSPSPIKASGPLLLTINQDILKYQKADKTIDKTKSVISSAQLYLGILSTSLNDLTIKVNQLQFIITDNKGSSNGKGLPTSGGDFISSLQDAKVSSANEEYVDNFGKSYTLKLVTLPNGSKQYQALDSYSKLKISQTAPSKIKTEQQLLEEIKQILG